MLPAFNNDGLLPVGIYSLTSAELLSSHLITGVHSQYGSAWNKEHRIKLAHNFIYFARQLWQVGATSIFIFGGFTEDNPMPNDIDGYFTYPCADEIRTGQLTNTLDTLACENIWDWVARFASDATKKNELAMWHNYRVEFVPTAPGLKNAMPVQDAVVGSVVAGNAIRLPVPTGVHISKEGTIKGIIQLIPDADTDKPLPVTKTLFLKSE